MSKIFLISGSVIAGLGVAIGAFGAHALKAILEVNNRLETFETGVKYQFYHALALIIVGLIMQKYESRMFVWAGYSYLIGILIFSGSLYILSLSGISKWGAITPIGGLALILGWIFMIIGLVKVVN
jgi:uncharacterized membrane protein YgdD (TMEM256/DUF423 family)